VDPQRLCGERSTALRCTSRASCRSPETAGTSTDTSSVYVYEADQVFAVFRQDTRVEVDSSRLFNSDKSELRAIMRATLAVPNPASVVRILGILA
jgi:hypothetical protein